MNRFMLAAFLLLPSFAFSHSSKNLCSGFVPENDRKIPVDNVEFNFALGKPTPTGLSKAKFNEVIDKVVKLYKPIVSQQGGSLSVNKLWTDPTVNASAEQSGNNWVLNMYGGLARHKAITEDGFALVVCHELGHHIGGAPKYPGDWASNEGESDYFANLKCLRNVFAQDDNEAIVAKLKVDPLAKKLCTSQFTKKEDQLICMRTSQAGYSVSYLFQDLRGEKKKPSLKTPDKNQVSTTNDDHPATQCRLDTYFAGSLCDVDASVPVSDTDYTAGSCVAPANKVGARPNCWFSDKSLVKNKIINKTKYF